MRRVLGGGLRGDEVVDELPGGGGEGGVLANADEHPASGQNR
jgi:hypothetical protein